VSCHRDPPHELQSVAGPSGPGRRSRASSPPHHAQPQRSRRLRSGPRARGGGSFLSGRWSKSRLCRSRGPILMSLCRAVATRARLVTPLLLELFLREGESSHSRTAGRFARSRPPSLPSSPSTPRACRAFSETPNLRCWSSSTKQPSSTITAALMFRPAGRPARGKLVVTPPRCRGRREKSRTRLVELGGTVGRARFEDGVIVAQHLAHRAPSCCG